MIFTNSKIYDNLKWLALVGLPANATLYLALAEIWNLSYGPEVSGTIMAIDTFLGVALGISKRSYDGSEEKYDGSMVVTSNEDLDLPDLYSLELAKDPELLAKQASITFKVEHDK